MKRFNQIIAYVESDDIQQPIKAKFFYKNNKVFYEVTKEICDAINKYNIYASNYIKQGKYRLLIPIFFENDYAVYPHGFGDTHYFVEHEFDRIDKYIRSFPLKKCTLKIIKVKNIHDVQLNKKQHYIIHGTS